jgi:hypothetical protein
MMLPDDECKRCYNNFLKEERNMIQNNKAVHALCRKLAFAEGDWDYLIRGIGSENCGFVAASEIRKAICS